MNDLVLRVAARYQRAAVTTIDIDFIEKLRRDFLMLMKNVPRVKDYKQAAELRDAVNIFQRNFNELYFEHFINHDLKYDHTLSDSDRIWFDKNLRKIGWDFYIDLSMNLSRPDEYYSEESRFSIWERERDKWANRLKTKARALWKALEEFAAYYQRTVNTSFQVKTPDAETTTIEGFKVVVIGYGHDSYKGDQLEDYMERFREGLRIYKRRAAQVLPLLLKVMLPIHLIAYLRQLDEGGVYKGKYIEFILSAFSEHKNGNAVAHVIAHEMGHHLFKTYLSQEDVKFWSTAIRGDYEPLDLRKALEVWPEGVWALDLPELLKDKDPVLALQIDVASYGHEGSNKEFQKREDVEKLLAEGQTIYVPKTPITGYAGKNAEEAFCEAIGRIVGYGPRTVYPLIVHWLEMILPDIRTASVLAERVAARYKEKKKVRSEDGGETTVYVYSERQVAKRNKDKAERIEKLSGSINKLRAKVKKDLKSSDPEKLLTALAVALIDHTYERVGNDESAKDGHFGVTGWKRKHVSFGKDGATIKYVGKSGVKHEKKVTDAAIKNALKDAYEACEGDDGCLFSWDGGSVSADKVNSYLKPFDVTAKDLRGYHANQEMRTRLKTVRADGGALPEDKKKLAAKLKAEFKKALEETSDAVGHEASTLKSQYLVPGLEDKFLEDGTIIDKLGSVPTYDDV